jgi:hypothetical protein
MKIVLESIDAANDPPVANLRVLYKGRLVGKVQLPVDGAASDASDIAERLRDFCDCLVDWTRGGAGLAAPDDGPNRLPRP